MRIVVLTSSRRGSAAVILPKLINQKGIEIVGVIYSHNVIQNKKKHYLRKIKKIIRIGLLGTWKGMQMRSWYAKSFQLLRTEELEAICERNGIAFEETPTINCDQTRTLFEKLNSDLGVSLGNGYIAPSVFNIPKKGMVNIHHEQLPEYQNAQSVIWQIYNGSLLTGFTIHKIDKHIDTGEILLQEIIPINFHEQLQDTVANTYAKLIQQSAKGLVKVLQRFDKFEEEAKFQGEAKSYTTPSIWEYLKIKKQHNILKINYNEDIDL